MRFLCLHGYGTCADVLRDMMEPVVEHLPSDWEYEFLEGSEESSKLMLTELDQVPPPNLCWHNYPHREAIQRALDHVTSFIEDEGPFDGLWGFSQGASMATLLLLEHQKENHGSHDWPFKMVIYNSTFLPYRLDSGSITWNPTADGEIEATYQPGNFDALCGEHEVDWKQDHRTILDYILVKRVQEEMTFPAQFLLKYRAEDVPVKLTVPSLHVRGAQDELFFVDDSVYNLFDPTMAKQMMHRGGHHLPREPDETIAFAELIIETAASII